MKNISKQKNDCMNTPNVFKRKIISNIYDKINVFSASQGFLEIQNIKNLLEKIDF